MLYTTLLLAALTFLRLGVAATHRSARVPDGAASMVEDVVQALAIAIAVIFLLVRPFVAQAFYIPSSSMTPTLRIDDRVLVDKVSYRVRKPGRGEIVVFRAPNAAVQEARRTGEDVDFIKRVVALPGDVVEVRDGAPYVNGRRLPPVCGVEPPTYDMAPTRVPLGALFVMGDNRNHSNDSHVWGPLPASRVIGRAMVVFWPPTHAGVLR